MEKAYALSIPIRIIQLRIEHPFVRALDYALERRYLGNEGQRHSHQRLRPHVRDIVRKRIYPRVHVARVFGKEHRTRYNRAGITAYARNQHGQRQAERAQRTLIAHDRAQANHSHCKQIVKYHLNRMDDVCRLQKSQHTAQRARQESGPHAVCHAEQHYRQHLFYTMFQLWFLQQQS